MNIENKKRIFLLDGHSLAHRAFYALPLLSNSEGDYTNSVFGFCRMLFKLIDDEDPDLLTVAFDKEAPTFRHEEYEEYKATRKKMPDELKPQIDLIKKVLKSLKIPIFEIEGYEADDVIGTLAKRAEKKGMEVNIVTGDRDALQLVTDSIRVLYTRKGITNMEEYTLEKVKKEYELEPKKLVDMKGLQGDSSDNIPGVPGIGKKTATKLLKRYSGIEEILENIEEISGKKRKENLRKYSEQARMSKKLGKIVVDVPLKIDLEDCVREEPDFEKVKELFNKLEFDSLLERFKTRETVNSEDINLDKFDSTEAIDNLIEQINENKKMAVECILKDYSNPLTSVLKGILVTAEGEKVYMISPEQMDLEKFKTVLEDKNIAKYFLHAKETMLYFKKQEIEVKGIKFDPLLAVYLLNSAKSLPSLTDILEKELDMVLEEDISSRDSIAYILSRIFEIEERLIPELKEMDVYKLYKEIEMPLIKVLVEMEYNGIKVNEKYLNKLSDKWEEELKNITEKVHELAGEKFNLNSPQQLGEILFDKLGLPVIKKTKTGYSTSIDVLEELEDKHEIIPLIMDYRQGAKFKSTYVDALPPLINERDGRIHTSFNQMVTATGRLSSTDPNLQNIPIRTEEGREIRKAFVPEDDSWILLAADYSQVELRVLAHISGDENLKRAFNTGGDIHTRTASEVFEVEPAEVTSNMRREAKVINFGIAYGMSPYGLSSDLNISRKEAEEYINKYFERFSGVKEYIDKMKEQAKKKGYVTTIFNRRRFIPEINSRNYHKRSFAERTAINTPIQGSAADIMKIAMIDVYHNIKRKYSDKQVRILLQVHDELVLEVKKDILKETAFMVKTAMEDAVELEVPLIADLQVGENWRDKKDYKLEE
ncbi:MAG: DNA polymerase I [Halanaerobiales bacterium]